MVIAFNSHVDWDSDATEEQTDQDFYRELTSQLSKETFQRFFGREQPDFRSYSRDGKKTASSRISKRANPARQSMIVADFPSPRKVPQSTTLGSYYCIVSGRRVRRSARRDQSEIAVAILHDAAEDANWDRKFILHEPLQSDDDGDSDSTVSPHPGRTGCLFYLNWANNRRFTFGRRPANSDSSLPDIVLPGSRQISRVHFKVSPDWSHNQWRVDALSRNPFVVNGVPLSSGSSKRPRSLYLHPFKPNLVIVETLKIYICVRKVPQSLLHRDCEQPLRSLTSAASSKTELDDDRSVDGMEDNWQELLYRLEKDVLASCLGRQLFRALDPFTGEQHLLELFGASSIASEKATNQFQFWQAIGDQSSVRRSLRRVVYKSDFGILFELVPDLVPLDDYSEELQPIERSAAASRLLRVLVDLLSVLQEKGITGVELSAATILVQRLGSHVADIRVEGFSNAVVGSGASPSYFAEICQTAVKVAMRLVNDIRPGTMGQLASIFEHAADPSRSWYHDALRLQHILETMDVTSESPWMTFQAVRIFQLRIHNSDEQECRVSTSDVQKLLLTFSLGDASVGKIMRSKFKSYLPEPDQYCSRSDIRRLHSSIQRKLHPSFAASVGFTLDRKLSAVGRHQNSVSLSVRFDIHYHRPSQMFNVTQLLRVAAEDLANNCARSPSLSIVNCQEVYGHSSLRGRYLPVENLNYFADSLGLEIDDILPSCSGCHPHRHILRMTKSSQYAHLASPDIAGTGLVDRRSRQIHWNNQAFSIDDFQTLHAASDLELPSSLMPPCHWSESIPDQSQSASTTITATQTNSTKESDGGFAFGPRLGRYVDGKETAEISQWVESTQNRKRRAGRTSC